MRLIRTTPGLVIRAFDHGESDKIVTFYSPVYGKLTCIAKGAKKSKKRFTNKLELFSRLTLRFAASGRSLHRLDEAILENPYPWVRNSPNLFAAASVLAEQLYFLTRENDGSQQIFDLYCWAYEHMQEDATAQRLLIFVQLKLFQLSGYAPALNACLQCQTTQAPFYFYDMLHHGLYCRACKPERQGVPISLATLRIMQKILSLPANKLLRLQMTDKSLDQGLRFTHTYATNLMQRDLQSWHIYEKLQIEKEKRFKTKPKNVDRKRISDKEWIAGD